ncbi:N-acetyltransferase [Spirochaetia bacterium]|nr:N-acetyltransferase [Spirochaetia bacterium]
MRVDEHTRLRFASAEDAELVLEFVCLLAEYEHLLDQAQATVEDFRKYVFEEKKAEVIIVEYDGQPAGFALFFHNFSTFLGRPGIYIEDLFVKPEFRGRGLGKLLLAFIAHLATERNCGRLEWSCLDWNEPSIAFYKSQGARPMSEWTAYRVTGQELEELALEFPEW